MENLYLPKDILIPYKFNLSDEEMELYNKLSKIYYPINTTKL